MGFSQFQHTAAYFLLKYTRTFGFPYIQNLAKAAILVYSVKAMNSTIEVESN
jgi:hypothetical protein